MAASDSETRSAPNAASGGAETADDRSGGTATARPLLSEIAARFANVIKRRRKDTAMRESLEEVIEESEREADELSAQERLMLANLLKIGELPVAEIMVPRADIVAVEADTALPELIALFREAQHSRLPIYRETLDDPLGIVHIKDVLAVVEIGPQGELQLPQIPITKLKRDVLFVPGAMPALDLLIQMQATRKHLALVVDEYGGTDGLISIEDLIEVIVGEIDDEHDVEESPKIVTRPDGGFDADARATLEEFNEHTGLDLAAAETDDEVDTLGGIVIAVLGRVPARGEIVSHGGFEFEILEADPRRVKRLRIRRQPPHVTGMNL